jgi:hypothetical protein
MRRLLTLAFLPLGAVLVDCAQFIGSECDIPGVCTSSEGGADGDSAMDAPPGCDLSKDPKDSPACIDDSVGIFVSSMGNDMNAGTKASPVKTLTAALAKKGKPRIYICEGAYMDSATITAPVSIYGALKCDWSIGGAKPKITGTKSDFVVKVDSVNGVVLMVDLGLVGKDGAGAGESSIAVFLNASKSVSLARVDVIGGKGVDGSPGTVMNFSYPDPPTMLKGADANGNAGGGALTVTCPDSTMTTGGKGGDTGGDGNPGLPMGTGGTKGNAGPMMSMACTAGGAGLAGANGVSGIGGTVGTLTVMGWSPGVAQNGQPGKPGGGGGGGGGQVAGVNSGGGGSGGGGACGGAGSSLGMNGGSSIAIAVLDSTASLTSCSLKSSDAGKGGATVAGQTGQGASGIGGKGSLAGCNGGNGGAPGGNGGAGGAGAGGISVGVVFKGTKPNYGADTMITTGLKGTGGTSPAGGMSNGADGVAQAELMSQ